MPLGLAMVLWIAEFPGSAALPRASAQAEHATAERATVVLSAAELAWTTQILLAAPAVPAQPAKRRTARYLGDADREAPTDLALLFGSRSGSGQVEMGALGGGRADAPGLVHIGVGLDF